MLSNVFIAKGDDPLLQDAMEVGVFARSEEAFAAEALFDAFSTGSPEDIKRCITQKSIFKDLDNQVTL